MGRFAYTGSMNQDHGMLYHETPSGQKLALGVTHDMINTHRGLDRLRSLAYLDGVPPLFSDEAPITQRPWDTREALVCDLAESYARLDALRSSRFRGYLAKDQLLRVSQLCDDIVHHGVKLEQAGWLMPNERPDYVAGQLFHTHSKRGALVAYYETMATESGPAPKVDARGASTEPFRPPLLQRNS